MAMAYVPFGGKEGNKLLPRAASVLLCCVAKKMVERMGAHARIVLDLIIAAAKASWRD